MKFKGILTPEEIAERLGVNEETVLGWREIGLPWIKIGKLILISEASFVRWMKSKEIGGNRQNASGQEFFGKPIGEDRPPKS